MNKREIKFKVWCKGTSENLNFNKPRYIKQNDFIFRKYFPHFPDLGDEEDNFVIEQFTGLKDKEGKEIYEGDIVEYGQVKALIIFSSGAFFVQTLEKEVSLVSNHAQFILKVIGNIHQNPELLK